MNLLTVSLHKRSYSLVLFIYIIERLVLSNYRSREIALKNEAITLTLGIFFHVTVLLQFKFSFRTTTQLPAKSCIKLLKLYRQFNSKKKFTYKHSIWTHTHTQLDWSWYFRPTDTVDSKQKMIQNMGFCGQFLDDLR